MDCICIVIDVLRATSVIAVLFDRSAPAVYIAASHDAARSFARAKGYLLCGETDGYRVPDFDYGNSPTEFASLDFAGRPLVLSTTNGTKAVASVATARRVYLGACINRSAVAAAAWRDATASGCDIVLVCSGTNGQHTLEDATAAGLYVEMLVSFGGPWTMPELDDASITARRLWQNEPNLLRGWMEGVHARNLGDRGFGEDVAYCAGVDRLGTIPVLVDEADVSSAEAPVVLIR
jgi:2-phosphosulfolactate phosphatase